MRICPAECLIKDNKSREKRVDGDEAQWRHQCTYPRYPSGPKMNSAAS